MGRILALFATLFLFASLAVAQSPIGVGQVAPEVSKTDVAVPFLSKRSQLSIDVTAIGGSASFAHGERTGLLFGACAGVGGDFLNFMAIAGRHFAQGLAYEPKDGYTNKRLFDLAHMGLFLRRQPSERWQYDVGLRGSVFLHGDSSDDDPGAGYFLGGYGALYFGGSHIKVGPRVLVGRFRCGRSDPEFGITISPITARFLVAW